jgi:hypothetical protein
MSKLAAHTLMLWKVSIPFEVFKAKAEHIKDAKDIDSLVGSKELEPVTKLSAYFTSTEDEHVRVIVARPPDGESKWLLMPTITDSSSLLATFLYRDHLTFLLQRQSQQQLPNRTSCTHCGRLERTCSRAGSAVDPRSKPNP